MLKIKTQLYSFCILHSGRNPRYFSKILKSSPKSVSLSFLTSLLKIITKRKTFCQAAGLFPGVESNLWNIVKYYLAEYNYSKISCRAAAVKGHFLHFIWCIAFKMHFSRQGVVGWRVFTKDLALVEAKLHSLYEKVLLLFLPESQLPEGADNSAKP